MKCECGRPIRRVVPADHIDLEWTHADGDEHIFAGPMCTDGYLDETGDWHDSPFAYPATPEEQQ